MSDAPASSHDTSSTDFVAPGQAPRKSGAPAAQVGRIKDFLAESMPDEFNNAPDDEFACDTAIRLLQASIAIPARSANSARCPEEYCNKISGHQDEHGWVNYDPRS